MIVVDEILLKDLYSESGEEKITKAKKIVEDKKVNITKVIYDNSSNFEVSSNVAGNQNIYDVYIKVIKNEIEDLRCTCAEYEDSYSACKHIIATMTEFSNSNKYILNNMNKDDKIRNKKVNSKLKSNHRIFKQLINHFYLDIEDLENEKVESTIINEGNIKIYPKLIYNEQNGNIKVEFKIGNKNLYKIKSLPDFFDRMMKEETFKYGANLEFKHIKESFAKEDIDILNFIMKYGEIIKYANESSNNYGYYARALSDSYILLSNTGMDELFSILKNRYIVMQNQNEESEILFIDNEPDIKFILEEKNEDEYILRPNIDIYSYDIFRGKDYIYFYIDNKMYKCDKKREKDILQILEIYRKNFTQEIDLFKEDLNNLFSIVYPTTKKYINLDKLSEEEIEKYVPKELYVKVYLDYDKNNFVTADIKFIYGDCCFNPLVENNIHIPRDVLKESENLEIFRRSGFMLDSANARLILVNDDLIYNFLTNDIETYMQKFEVLVTDNFKQKEVKGPKIVSLGVRVENNLLNIDLTKLDFEPSELVNILNKYKLKKKFYRLKDGSFLELQNNEDLEFMNNITESLDIDYKELQKGTLKLPIYRSLYLDKLLDNLKNVNVHKDEQYKKIIKDIGIDELNDEISVPKSLNADLRLYQKIGFKWLKSLNEYNLGGILADDMGLGKTVQLLALILDYKENNKETKPTIVVSPSSLTLNWQSEICKFANNLRVQVIHGSVEDRINQINKINDFDVVITSYDLLKRDIDLYKEKNIEFQYIIADEAQYIKNNNTQNSKAIKEINAKTKFALTGTPIENSLSELWSIFDFIMPGYLFSYRKFKQIYELPIIKENDLFLTNRLKKLISPFILRRIKKDVLTELPDKTITVLNNEMQGEQLDVYMSYLAQAKKEVVVEIKNRGFEASQMKILALLMRLRQICCHPSLFIENYEGESSKLNQCMQITKDAVEGGHKILLFSGYTSMFNILEQELKKEKIEYFKLTGQTKVVERIKLVDEFNQNDNIKVFLISLKAGGTGLNLTGADMVIHYDPWWNISAENQATDRTYRIGQKKNVQVYKLITRNSIEEKIYELQRKKEKLIDNMLSTKETFINKLSKEEIMELFR